MTDIVMAAGEASGDWLAAQLANDLRRLRPDIHIAGVGGPLMRAAGVELLADCAPLSVMGYWDAIKRLPAILSVRRRLLAAIQNRRPALFIGIDAPDFNLGVSQRAHSWGIKTAQYVSPSVWMWRANRIQNIRLAVDSVLCLFPFELAYYEKSGVTAHFVGHPAAKTPVPDRARARAALSISDNERVIALMPGSRSTELRQHLPLFAETIRRLSEISETARKNGRLIALATDELSAKNIRIGLPSVEVRVGATQEILAAADVAMVKSGTSTLQAALLGVPMVIVYKLSTVAHAVGAWRQFRLPFFGLPNILCGRFVVPELLQNEFQPVTVATELKRLLEYEQYQTSQTAAFTDIRQRLANVEEMAAAKATLAMLP
ncbi:lipid-A-disaccharide synthase [Candidatus Persebacteraceae bacterium Df01]|jgi:lipid-A-disaccharide synthase|uniref:Lipid-A-disaccharide synthase n=1 Tax=Candidatus Doriopsillibacter californiensis TaxID=2970740 RepID=A0ABT7QND3_9GAMM|nr:lipid-A-disaccharide synthase [Candidatus Persebacteraceae bacterium Df01]